MTISLVTVTRMLKKPDWCTPALPSFLEALQVESLVALCWRDGGATHRLPVEVTGLTGSAVQMWQVQVSRDTGHSNLKRVVRESRLFWVEALGSAIDLDSATCLTPSLTVERLWWLRTVKVGDCVRYWRSRTGLISDLECEAKVITSIAQRRLWLQPVQSSPSGSVQIRRGTGAAKQHVAWVEPLYFPQCLEKRLAAVKQQALLSELRSRGNAYLREGEMQ